MFEILRRTADSPVGMDDTATSCRGSALGFYSIRLEWPFSELISEDETVVSYRIADNESLS